MNSGQLPNDPVQSTYQKALEMIFHYTGLELTLIEKVHLRRLAAGAHTRLQTVTTLENAFHPTFETIGLFLHDYYNTPAFHTCDYIFLAETRRRLIRERGYDSLAEFYKKKQEEYHTLQRREEAEF